MVFFNLYRNDGRKYKGLWLNGKQNGKGEFLNSKENFWRKGEWDEGKRIRWIKENNEHKIN